MPEIKLQPGQLRALFIAIPTAIVALAVIFVLVGHRTPPAMQMPPQKVILGQTEVRDITQTQEFVAVMEADNIVDLKARVSGFLVAKNFQDGDLVKSGQLLFQIEPDQYKALLDNAQANVLSAQARLVQASLDFDRITDLFHKKTSPKSDYDRSKADYEVAQAAVESAKAAQTQAQLNLDYASIKAPFDGQVSDTPYSEGSLLGPESGVLATVVSVDPILVTFGVSEKIISSAQPESMARHRTMADWQVRLRLGPDQYYDRVGKLTYVAPTVDPKTDTIKFKAKFENPDKLLRPGQILTAVVERTTPEKKLIVPKEAVLTDTDGSYVYVTAQAPANPEHPEAAPGLVAEIRRVTLENGDTLVTEYVVKDGLKAGEKFILKGLLSGGATLRPGAAVEVVSPDQAGAPAGAQAPAKDDQKAPAEGGRAASEPAAAEGASK